MGAEEGRNTRRHPQALSLGGPLCTLKQHRPHSRRSARRTMVGFDSRRRPELASALRHGDHLSAEALDAGDALLGRVTAEPERYMAYAKRRQGGSIGGHVVGGASEQASR